jgi:hypothetical protein
VLKIEGQICSLLEPLSLERLLNNASKFSSTLYKTHCLFLETTRLVMFREVISACCESHTQHVNAPFGHIVKLGGTHFYHPLLKF